MRIPTSSLKWMVCGLQRIERDQAKSSTLIWMRGPHLEGDEAFLLTSEPTFFMMVSPPDEAASTVCRSIERLIFALRSCANYVSGQSRSLQTSPQPARRWQGRGGNKKIRVRTLFREAIFIASAFFGAMYRFPFLVAEEDEAGRVAFCFEVCMPFTLP